MIHIRFSNDYCVSWSDEDKTLTGDAVTNFPMTAQGGGADVVEPWLYLAPNGDLIFHMWSVIYGDSYYGAWQAISSDGGETWGAPAVIDYDGLTAEEDVLSYATDDHFVYDGVIYAAARQYGASCKAMFIKSTDNGATWTYVSDMSDFGDFQTQETGIEYLGDSTILAIFREQFRVKTYYGISTDMGATWPTLIDISSAINVIGRPRITTDAHVKEQSNWWTDTRLIMTGFVFTTPGVSEGRRIAVWLSEDGGTSWTKPIYLDDADEDGGYGDLIYDPNNDTYRIVTYKGTQAAASLMQYNFKINWTI